MNAFDRLNCEKILKLIIRILHGTSLINVNDGNSFSFTFFRGVFEDKCLIDSGFFLYHVDADVSACLSSTLSPEVFECMHTEGYITRDDVILREMRIEVFSQLSKSFILTSSDGVKRVSRGTHQAVSTN